MIRQFAKFVAVIAVLVALTSQAQAAFTLTIEQSGPDVVATGSGTINLSALMVQGSESGIGAYIFPDFAIAALGTEVGTTPLYGPQNFAPFSGGVPDFGGNGSFMQYLTTSTTGDYVAIEGPDGHIAVPPGYVSGTFLSGTATFANETIAGMTLTPGSFTWSWGTAATADSFTVNIIGVPEPASLILGIMGLLALLAMARRRHQV